MVNIPKKGQLNLREDSEEHHWNFEKIDPEVKKPVSKFKIQSKLQRKPWSWVMVAWDYSGSFAFSIRCFFIAQSYVLVKKWSEALVLYDRVLKYANEVSSDAGPFRNSLKVSRWPLLVSKPWEVVHWGSGGAVAPLKLVPPGWPWDMVCP